MSATTSLPVDGHCDARFRAVREAFVENFTTRGDCGAAVCIWVDGRAVVDLWGGWADGARTRPWRPDTIASCASLTKGITATCAHRLVGPGKIDVDRPVAHYWPEFAQAAKGGIPVRWLLSHRAGLPAIRRDLPPDALYDWDGFCATLAAEEPWWTPGTRHGYHATTFGFLVGEVMRRVDGRSVGRQLAEDVAGPLGADYFIGVPASKDRTAAEILPAPPPEPGEETLHQKIAAEPCSMLGRAFLNPARDPAAMNSRAWRAAEMPASNGHGSARGVARIYAALSLGGAIDGVRVLEREWIERAIVEQSNGTDAVLGRTMRFGLGYALRQTETGGLGLQGVIPNPRAFGHTGRGGSIGFADMEANVGFGYIPNQYLAGTERHPDERWTSLAGAFYEALG